LTRNAIELFLSENPSESFKASEVAKRLKIPRGEAEKRLRKLAKQGRVAVKRGRYRALKVGPADFALRTTRKLEETARRVGISAEVLLRWAEERRRRASEEETKKLLYGILHDVEESKGMKAKGQPEK
jgi:Mn-dependent DtxR family transcriptional regulator